MGEDSFLEELYEDGQNLGLSPADFDFEGMEYDYEEEESEDNEDLSVVRRR